MSRPLRLHVSGTAPKWVEKHQQLLRQSSQPVLKHYYQQSIVSGTTPLCKTPFLAMDFETTGLDHTQDEIISVGVVPFDLRRVYLNQAKDWTLKPHQSIEDDSVVIHGITHSDVKQAPDFGVILEDLLEMMAGKIIVVHYRWIERAFLSKELNLRIKDEIEFPVIDTMELEALIQHAVSGGMWNRIRGRKKQSVRLGKSRSRYGLPAYTPHHALTDAIATAELFQAQVAHHFSDEQPIEELWL